MTDHSWNSCASLVEHTEKQGDRWYPVPLIKGMGGGKKDFCGMGANPSPSLSLTNCDFETSESQLFRKMIKRRNKR